MNAEKEKTLGLALRIIIPVVIVCVALMAFGKMKAMKRKPSTKERKEPMRQVTVMTVRPSNELLTLTGFAYVGSQTRVPVSAEVRGRLVQVRDRLEDGEFVNKGELLLKIDDRDATQALAALDAERERLKVDILRLEMEKKNLEETLALRKRIEELSENEKNRLESLSSTGGSISKAAVEAAEQRLVNAKETVASLRQRLALLPLQRKSLEASLRITEAQIAQQTLNVERCSIQAPIRGRLKEVAVEYGQLVQPGQPLFLIVDDNDLAAQVDLPASDVLKWMPITPTKDSSWISANIPITADFTWVDDPTNTPVTGTLLRISGVDGTTRTARLIFSIPNQTPRRMFEGMFCRAAVRGRTLNGVFKIPRRVLTVEGRVPMVSNGRLTTKPVTVIAHQGEDVILAKKEGEGQLQPGDVVITSPIQSLPEGYLVEPTPQD